MKRILIPGLMLAAAFALTNCSEQLVPPVQESDSIVEEKVETSQVEEVPFEVFAQSEDTETKTSATGSKGYLKWEAGDALNVFHSQAGKNSYSKHGEFVVDANKNGVKTGLFIGNLILSNKVQLHENNDWFFLYPYSSGDTPTVTNNVVTLGKVTIGSAAGGVQYQKAANSKEHIAGKNYPMYGKVQNLAKSKNPAANMKHLSALVAVKVVNEGHGGDITIEDVEFEAKEDIVGDFTLKMPASGGHTFTGQGTAEAKKAKVAFNNPETNFSSVTIAKNESTTLYLAVKPFTVKSGASLTIRVNGSARTVKMSKDVTFEAGKVTTIKVPVKDYVYDADNNPTGYPFTSGALSITSKGRLSSDAEEKILTINGTKQTATINGMDGVEVYVVGSTGTAGSIKIKGFAKDMINALPLSFFASQYNNNPTAMTIKSVNVWLPEYGSNYANLRKRTEFKSYSVDMPMKVNGYSINFPLSMSLAAEVLDCSFDNGITRDILVNNFGIAASTITFNGMVESNHFDEDPAKSKVVILDDEPVNKDISIEKVRSYIERFSGNGKTASYEGLCAILNAGMDGSGNLIFADENEKNMATETAEAIIAKVQSVVGTRKMTKTINLFITKVTAEVTLAEAVSPGVFTSATDLMHKLRDMKFELTIETYPYATKYTTETPTTTLQPIVFWGFDAYGVDK